MPDEKKLHPIRVSSNSFEALKSLAKEKDCTIIEAADRTLAAGFVAQSMGDAQVPSTDSVLSEETRGILSDWAQAKGLTLTAAAERLISVGITRLQALEKYGNKKKG